MTNQRRNPADPDSDPVEFGEWLQQTADSRGVSRDEILEQLISSYWKLNEMSEMITEPSESDADPFGQAVSRASLPVTRAEFEGFQSDLSSRLADVEQRVDAVEADGSDDADDRLAEIEQTLETEFSTLRRILEHLIEAKEMTEDDIDDLRRRIDHDIPGLQEELAQLAHIRRRAMEVGTRSADCDNCGHTVDLSLLPSPRCPTCGRSFSDIIPRRKFLGISFGSDTLKTESPIESDIDGDRREAGDGRARGASETGENRIDGFVWGDNKVNRARR